MTLSFVDSNVLIYSAVDDPNEAAKSRRALEILTTTEWACSVQVLQEFYWQVTRPARRVRLTHPQAMSLIEEFRRVPIQEMTIDVFLAATSTADRFQISYWNAAIVEAARALGCGSLLSEDLQHGQDFGGVRVVNPFL